MGYHRPLGGGARYSFSSSAVTGLAPQWSTRLDVAMNALQKRTGGVGTKTDSAIAHLPRDRWEVAGSASTRRQLVRATLARFCPPGQQAQAPVPPAGRREPMLRDPLTARPARPARRARAAFRARGWRRPTVLDARFGGAAWRLVAS